MSTSSPRAPKRGNVAGQDEIAILEPTAGPCTTTTPLYSPHPRSPPRPQLAPSPIPILPLPPASSLNLESLASSELELDRQARQIQRERELAEALQDQQFAVDRQSARNTSLWTRTLARTGRGGTDINSVTDGPSQPFSRPPQAYELYKAIDKHDIEFIMRVRDHAFQLLLQKNAGEFPIVYASRIGKTHRDIVVLLVGALSRYVNQLDDEDFEKKETKGVLRSLRSNLKIAIDQSLLPASSGSNLLSSYLQVLIMSEGDSFLHKAIYDISLVLRDPSPTTSKPVSAAEEVIRRFCTKELRGVEGGVEGVEDYVANAVVDLIMMSTWSIAATQLGVDGLPTYTFARDLRTCQMLKEAMEENKNELHKVNKRIRGILDKLVEIGGDTVKGVRGRMREMQLYLEGDGGV